MVGSLFLNFSFFWRAAAIVKKIPRGKVATYGQVAALAGSPRAARQVAWVLHAVSRKEKLPWHRVVSQRGTISLSHYGGYDLQRALPVHEGVKFDPDDRIDLKRHQWRPRIKPNSLRSWT